MKLLAPIAAIIAAAAASQIYSTAPQHPQQESYANSAEIYQSQLEYQQQGLYADQPQAHTGHGLAYQKRPSGEKVAKILSFESESDGHGYQYAYETENGIKAQEIGQTVKGTEAHGGYSYTGDDGQTYTITYTADEHGFHPQGDHLPTPPPIPEAIAKAIEQNAKDEAAGIHDDGHYVEQHHEDQGYEAEIHQGQAQAAHQQIQHQKVQTQQIQHPQLQYQHLQHQKLQPHQLQNQQLHHPVPPQGYQQPHGFQLYQPSAFQHEGGYSGRASSAEMMYHKH